MTEPVAAVATPDRPIPAVRRVRKVAGRAGLASAVFVFLLPHFWIGLALIAGSVREAALPFVEEDVVGHVAGKSTGRAKNGGVTRSITVDYALEDGAHATESFFVGEREYAAAVQGTPVPLRAGRALGWVSAHRPGTTGAAPGIWFAAVVWNAFMSVFLYQMAWVPLSRWWLVRRGAAVVASVDDVRRGAKGLATVRYSFVPDGGGPRVEGAMTVVASELDAAALGASTTVFHAPRWPRLSAIGALTSWEPVG
jgi:hypothetical protein